MIRLFTYYMQTQSSHNKSAVIKIAFYYRTFSYIFTGLTISLG